MVREALSGLTTRGRCFLAAGLAASLTSLLLGQGDLLRVAVLLAALPLVSAVVVTRTRYRLACSRRLSPGRVEAGHETQVVLRFENVSRLPTGLLLLEDRLPYVLGSRPRFMLDRVEPRGTRTVGYPVRAEVRGRYVIGPLTIRLSDPFGMCELVRGFNARDTLVVTPVVQRLPSISLGGDWAGSGDSRARSVASAGEDDVATREYRHGDDLRRVHWKSTAHLGELMVRREEQPWESHCTLLLDTRADAHRGDGPASSFEWAVTAAASIGVHAGQAGYTVDLVTQGGARLAGHGEPDARSAQQAAILDALASVQVSDSASLRASEGTRIGPVDGLLVVVLGATTIDEAEALIRAHHRGASSVAVLLDVATWRSARSDRTVLDPDVDATAAVLRGAGWRVLTARSGDRLPDLWPAAARGSTLDRRTAGDAA
jgi:uncharacterized protein (DUF58 family)